MRRLVKQQQVRPAGGRKDGTRGIDCTQRRGDWREPCRHHPPFIRSPLSSSPITLFDVGLDPHLVGLILDPRPAVHESDGKVVLSMGAT